MPTFTAAQLEDRVWAALDGNDKLYPKSNVLSILNQGLCRINLMAGLYQDRAVVPGFSVKNQVIYWVPSPIVVPMKVWFEGEALELISMKTLAKSYRNWTTDNSTYFGPPARAAFVGLNQFVLHPADALGGRLLEVSGIVKTPLMTTDNSVVQIEDQFADLLVEYARIRLMLKESGAPFTAAASGFPAVLAKTKTVLIWQGMKFPRFWIEKETVPADGKGT